MLCRPPDRGGPDRLRSRRQPLRLAGHDPCDANSSGTVRIHDAATGEPYVEMPGVRVRRGALAIATDSRRLVTANDIGPVTIWDLATDRRLAEMKNSARHAVHDRPWLAAASGRTIRVSPAGAAKPAAVMRVDNDVSSWALDPVR
jgi:hypothetical protein